MMEAMPVMVRPTHRLVRVPMMTRVKMSSPISSVPNQCDGGWRLQALRQVHRAGGVGGVGDQPRTNRRQQQEQRDQGQAEQG